MNNPILENFECIYKKKIILHNDIKDEDLRIIYVDGWSQLYIVDINDIENYNSQYIDFINIPKTTYISQTVRFRSWSIESIVYPYLNYKTLEQMQNETLKIVKIKNPFLTKPKDILKSTVIILLEKSNDEYFINYFFNKKVIDKISNIKRDPKAYLFHNIISLQIKENILDDNEIQLNNLLESTEKFNVNDLDNFVCNKNILKTNIKLFNYQMNDIQWMNQIENNIKSNSNNITFTYSQIKPILNDKLLYIDGSIIPNITKTDENNNQDFSMKKSITYYGGNLISEVGLGKTIISLYHCLNSTNTYREKYNKFVEFNKSKCNYMYKRGNKKGNYCDNNSLNESLFCKEHKNSIFIEKRNIQYKNLFTFNPKDFIINKNNKNLINTNSCLIICPNQLCDQWVKEYYDKFINDKRVILIVTKDQYDNLTLGDILFSDLVIISYNFLLNTFYKNSIISDNKFDDYINKYFNNDFSDLRLDEYYTKIEEILKSKALKNLHFFHWDKILLDEAHEIQNMNKSHELKSIIKIFSSNYKWNLSGTPFANGLDSYLNLMSYNTSYNKEYTTLCNYLGAYNLISSGLNSDLVLSSKYIFKRNTKKSIFDEYSGNLINEFVKKLNFTDQERNMYNSYLQNNQNKYIDILIKLCCHCELFEGTKTLIKNCKTLDEIQKVMLDYNKNKLSDLQNQINILQKNIKNMENLISETMTNDNDNDIMDDLDYYKSMITTYKKSISIKTKEYDNIQRIYNYLYQTLQTINDNDTCPICLDIIEKDTLTITKCGHKFCWECILDTHNIKKECTNINLFKCPSCNQEMNFNEIYLLKDKQNEPISNELNDIINNVKSTKIGNIIYFIKTQLHKGDKIILFSQWDELLHKVGDLLKNWNINIVYCNGSVYQRKRAIELFKNDDSINVIMLSSRNAASGINLTCANKIILLEPIYGTNEYRQNIESQAIGRADRIGQERSIEVYKFIIQDTIEEDLLNNTMDDRKIKQLTI